ncbi:MAG TPA: hypothetical protein VK165_11065 [Azonexus sp.]|nr:hypothetical protein [Azonexus sp.]
MNNRFFDLAWNRQPDGAIRLTQTDCGDPYIVDAHPEQILFIARQLCGMKPDDANKVAELERRLSILTDRMEGLVTADWFRSQIIDHCGDGIEIVTKLDALLDLAIEFDGGRLLPSETNMPTTPPSSRKTGADNTTPQRQDESGTAAQQMGLPV